MPFAVTCGGCRKTFQAKDDLAGKRVKCPSCGATVAIPALAAAGGRSAGPVSQAPPSSPPLTSGGDGSDGSSVTERPRKRKRKHARSDRPAEPLFSLGGVDFTAMKLVFVLPFVLALGAGAFFLFRWLGRESGPNVRIVDVYMAVNSVSYTGVGEMALQSQSLPYTIPGHRKLVVTRESPEGGFLLMKVRIKDDVLARYLPATAGSYMMTRGYIKLRGGSETVEPLFVTDMDKIGGYLDMGFNPPLPREGAKGVELRECLGPGEGEWKDWAHEGNARDAGGGIQFDGKRGMKVTVKMTEDRPGGEGRNVLEGLTGAKIGKGIEAGGLVAAPAAYVRAQWDRESNGWLVAQEIERPNELARTWELTCIFPRPKGSGKELTLIVFQEEKAIQLP